MNQLEDNKNIYKQIHDSQKQMGSNSLINVDKAPERLRQSTVKKDLHKGKYRLVTTQQQEKETDKNRQIHLQIKINSGHLKNITKIDKHNKLNSTSTMEHKTQHNYTLVNQAINIRKSNKGMTKEIEDISKATDKGSKGGKNRTGK